MKLTEIIEYIVDLGLKIKQILGEGNLYAVVCYQSDGVQFLYIIFKDKPIVVDSAEADIYVTEIFQLNNEVSIKYALITKDGKKVVKYKKIKL